MLFLKQIAPLHSGEVMKDLQEWIQHVEETRPAMNALAQCLTAYGAVVEPEDTRVVGELPY